MKKEEFVDLLGHAIHAYHEEGITGLMNNKTDLILCCKELDFQDNTLREMLWQDGKNVEDNRLWGYYCQFHWDVDSLIVALEEQEDKVDYWIDDVIELWEMLKNSVTASEDGLDLGFDWID